MGRRPRSPSFDQTSSLKGRIAEALVEAIFRGAGYVVSRTGRESQVQRLIRIGSDEFLPDFLITKKVGHERSNRPLHRLVPIEVKYRHDLAGFLRRYGRALFEEVPKHWPDLCLVFVTDNPEPGRSCFQIVDFWQREREEPRDLHTVADLDVSETTVREYESLVREIFSLLDRPPVTVQLASPALPA